MKRQRGRNNNRRNNNNNSNNNSNPNRSMDSNGPDVKIRGSATTIFEKYTNLARDAKTSGNRVKAENLSQHAEHYLRLMKSLQPKVDPAVEAAKAKAAEELQAAAKAALAEGRSLKPDSDAGDNSEAKSKPKAERKERDDQPKEKTQSSRRQRERDPVDVTASEGAPNESAQESPKPVKTSRRRKAPVSDKSSAQDVTEDAAAPEGLDIITPEAEVEASPRKRRAPRRKAPEKAAVDTAAE